LDHGSKPDIDVAKWREALDRLLSTVPERALGPVAGIPRWAESGSIVVVGPTGSGKSALVNAILGFSLLPEGTDHTTPVPTVVRRGDSFLLKAVDHEGATVRCVPELRLDSTLIPKDFPQDLEGTLARIRRREDFAALQQRWRTFWAPAFQAAKEDRCGWIEVLIPGSFIPDNVTIVDVPGYEGWFPEQCPRLHAVVHECLEHTRHAVFVMEKTKVFLAGSFEFLKRPLERETPSTLLINQMDGFNPFQFGAASLDDHSVWEKFRDHLRLRLVEEGVPVDLLRGIFLGASVQSRPIVEPAWMGHALLTEMLALFLHLREALVEAAETGGRAEAGPSPLEALLTRELEGLRLALDEARSAAGRLFQSQTNATWVKRRIECAIDEVDFDVRDVLTGDHRLELAKRMEQAALNTLAKALRELSQPALSRFHELTALHVQTSLCVTLRTEYAVGVSSVLNASRPKLGLELTTDGLHSELERQFQILFPFLGLAVNLLDVLTGWSTDDVRASVKKGLLPLINPPFLSTAWNDAVKGKLTARTLKLVWEGKDSDGARVKDSRGEVWPGLESLIRAAFQEGDYRAANSTTGLEP
jgi:hypothetical protein